MHEQELYNWIFGTMAAIFGLLGSILGFLMRTLWQSVTDLQKADTQLTEKISSIETLVAGQYIKRDEHHVMISALFAKLDRIYDKLDGKADKK